MEKEKFNDLYAQTRQEFIARFSEESLYERIAKFSSKGNGMLTPEETTEFLLHESVSYTNDFIYELLSKVLVDEN